jgi:dipeptidyl-peptidase 9
MESKPNGGWRLYFLCVPLGERENTILYVDLSPDANVESDINSTLEWYPLLSSFQPASAGGMGQMSREEQLLRERKRVRSIGITSYDYHHFNNCGHFVFPAANSIFLCTDRLCEPDKPPLSVTEVKTECVNSRIDPKLCPSHPDLLAFVSGLDLWVTCLSSGCERRLTFVHKGLKNLAADALSAGVPSFVVQEEFDRYTGFWWQPSTVQSDIYRILYEEVDESEVDILHIVSPQSEGATSDQYRYPKAGTANAKCTLKIMEFALTYEGSICDVVEKRLPQPLVDMFPSMEYIVRAGWIPDGTKVYAELMNRCQTKLMLVVFDLNCFTAHVDDLIDETQPQHMDTIDGDGGSGCVWTIYQETSDIWIEVHDMLNFMSKPSTASDELSFIWASAKSGFMHLYLVTVQLDRHAHAGAQQIVNGFHTIDCARARLVSEVQLTHGDWAIDYKQIWVDEENNLVYFVGYKDTPLETHLYVVSLQQPGVVIRLTKLGFSHTITMDKSRRMFVTVNSSLTMPTATEVYQINKFDSFGAVSASQLCTVQRPTEMHLWKAPELFQYQSDSGFTMYGMMYLPNNFDKTMKYPVILYAYAGPHVQLVTNSYKAIRFLRLHTLASVGYIVVVIDSRGSSNRGVKFESYLYSQLGSVEVAEQVEGLKWLASNNSFIDMDRVAIHGWSYGGYVSLMALVQRPDIFKVAIAGAPVTSWHLYDTGYTERYLDLPKNNPTAYSRGSVLELVEKFPNEVGRLLIVHGLIDENVLFYHTSSLVDALVKACKPHLLQIYPSERHGIRNAEANEHFETLLIYFLQQNL